MKLILASASPRRRDILSKLVQPCPTNHEPFFELTIVPSTFAEDLDKSQFVSPKQYVLETAICKAKEVSDRLKTNDLIVAADTIVVLGDSIIEKPTCTENAKEILQSLSGKEHLVITAIVLIRGSNMQSFVECTQVQFTELSQEMIHWYVATGESMDKAGAYGYQGQAAAFVEKLQGCYYNILGFPLTRFMKVLHEFCPESKDLWSSCHFYVAPKLRVRNVPFHVRAEKVKRGGPIPLIHDLQRTGLYDLFPKSKINVSKPRNGLKTFVPEINKITFLYSTAIPITHPFMQFIQEKVPEFAKLHPYIEFCVAPQSEGQESAIVALYGNGRAKIRTMDHKKLQKIEYYLKELAYGSGQDGVLYESTVLSDNESITPLWHPFHSQNVFRP